MEDLTTIENDINSYKIKTASLTYFTIFSNCKRLNEAENLSGNPALSDFTWSDRLEKALKFFNDAGSDFRKSPTPENYNKYKNATEVYYDALLDKYDRIPKAIVDDFENYQPALKTG